MRRFLWRLAHGVTKEDRRLLIGLGWTAMLLAASVVPT